MDEEPAASAVGGLLSDWSRWVGGWVGERLDGGRKAELAASAVGEL